MCTGINNNLILILGGAKSGKTDSALQKAEKKTGEKIYLATATILDEEMAEKVLRHKKSRGREWKTIEEPLGVTQTLLSLNHACGVVVLDCMTLWLSNIISDTGQDEEAILTQVSELIDAVEKIDYTLFIVSNELGMGIVPNNPLARFFRNISGKTNQMIAKKAGEVYMVTAGIAVKIK